VAGEGGLHDDNAGLGVLPQSMIKARRRKLKWIALACFLAALVLLATAAGLQLGLAR